jgi:hypothetical protein
LPRLFLGDWLVDGKQHYGDGLYKRAAEITGFNDGTLRQFASLSEQFQLLCRHNNLSYQHHREVASIKQIVEAEDGTLSLSDEPARLKTASCRFQSIPQKTREKAGLPSSIR